MRRKYRLLYTLTVPDIMKSNGYRYFHGISDNKIYLYKEENDNAYYYAMRYDWRRNKNYQRFYLDREPYGDEAKWLKNIFLNIINQDMI